MNILRVKALIVLLLTLVVTAAFGGGCRAQDGGAYLATTIGFEKTDLGFAVTIKGNMSPTFTTYQLFDPLRVVVDIANATFAQSLHLPIEVNQVPLTKITGTMLTEKKPAIAKLEILLSVDSQYTVKRNGNDISIVFSAEGTTSSQIPPSSPLSWKPYYAWQLLSHKILILSCFAFVEVGDMFVSYYFCLDFLLIHR